jgi:hypothetical protein
MLKQGLKTVANAVTRNTVSAAPVRRGIPLGAVVKQLNQTREFSKSTTALGGHKHDDHAHHKHDDHDHHDEHHDDHHHGPVFVEDPNDPYDGIGPYIPRPPVLDVILAKIIGAFAVFWVLYWSRERGLMILGLEAPHWEHGVGDTDSEEDDKDWDEEVDDDEYLEEILTTYMSRPNYESEPIDRKIRFNNTYQPAKH